MSEPTKEEMQAYHEGMIDSWHPKSKQCHEAIRNLIENMDKKPKVTKEWLNQLAINLIMATSKVKGKDLAMTVLHALVVNELKNELTAQGIEINEGGKDES